MKYLWILIFIAMPAYGQKMKATATAHGVDLSWTAPATPLSGEFANVYRGTSAGAESATPINSTAIPITTTTFSDSNVTAGATYYYIGKGCVTFGGTQVCSAPTNEVSVQVPLLSADVPALSGFAGSAH